MAIGKNSEVSQRGDFWTSSCLFLFSPALLCLRSQGRWGCCCFREVCVKAVKRIRLLVLSVCYTQCFLSSHEITLSIGARFPFTDVIGPRSAMWVNGFAKFKRVHEIFNNQWLFTLLSWWLWLTWDYTGSWFNRVVWRAWWKSAEVCWYNLHVCGLALLRHFQGLFILNHATCSYWGLCQGYKYW